MYFCLIFNLFNLPRHYLIHFIDHIIYFFFALFVIQFSSTIN